MEFKPWMRWALIGAGVLVVIGGIIWVMRRRARAQTAADDSSVSEDEAVALFTPSPGPGAPAGLSDFPDQIPIASGLDFFSLLDKERAIELEDRTFAQEDKITQTLRNLWNDINKDNIRTGKPLTKVCITTTGAVGAGDQCKKSKNPQRVYGGE